MLTFENQSSLLSSVRRCVQHYDMIQNGDRIAVGLSGGKDSLTLLSALAVMRRFYPEKYTLCAVTVDLGFDGMDFSALSYFCGELDVPHRIIKTDIAKIVFEEKKEDSPCSLCSRLRRGALHQEAERLGCNKLALGHNRDDASVTLMMNLLYAGKIGVFAPKNDEDGHGVTLIRPLLYTSEKTVKAFARKNSLPIVKNNCPADKKTHREAVKSLIESVEHDTPGASYRIFRAIEKANLDGFKDTSSLN